MMSSPYCSEAGDAGRFKLAEVVVVIQGHELLSLVSSLFRHLHRLAYCHPKSLTGLGLLLLHERYVRIPAEIRRSNYLAIDGTYIRGV